MLLGMAGMLVHTNSLIKKYEDQNHICWSHSQSYSEEKSKSKYLPLKMYCKSSKPNRRGTW